MSDGERYTGFQPGPDPRRGDPARASAVSAQRRRKLTLEDVETELGPLVTPQDAKRWLQVVVTWAAARLVPGSVANACASLLREWIKAHAEEVDAERVKQLERRIAELEAELRQARRRS